MEIKKEQSNKKLEKSDNLKHNKIIYGCAHRFIAQHMTIELDNADIGTIHCHGRGGALQVCV